MCASGDESWGAPWSRRQRHRRGLQESGRAHLSGGHQEASSREAVDTRAAAGPPSAEARGDRGGGQGARSRRGTGGRRGRCPLPPLTTFCQACADAVVPRVAVAVGGRCPTREGGRCRAASPPIAAAAAAVAGGPLSPRGRGRGWSEGWSRWPGRRRPTGHGRDPRRLGALARPRGRVGLVRRKESGDG